MIQSRKDCTGGKWSILKRACWTMFEEGRSNIFIHERTLLDLDDISKLREDYEREKILESKKQYDEEYLSGDNE